MRAPPSPRELKGIRCARYFMGELRAYPLVQYLAAAPSGRLCRSRPQMNAPKLLLSAALAFSLSAATLVRAATPPETTPDGLVLLKKTSADLVYHRPGVSFGGYTKVLLVEPTIAFRKHWKTDISFETPSRPVTDADMERIIAKGKELLLEQLAAELTKAGYKLADG